MSFGSNWVSDTLLVQGGGTLSDGASYTGYEVGADNNTAVISGTGSVWVRKTISLSVTREPGSQLIITNGGAYLNSSLYVPIWATTPAVHNTILVSDRVSLEGIRLYRYSGSGNQ